MSNHSEKIDEFNTLYEYKMRLTQLVNSGHINLQNKLIMINRRLSQLRAELAAGA